MGGVLTPFILKNRLRLLLFQNIAEFFKKTAQACYEKVIECYKDQSRYTSVRNSYFGRKQPRFTIRWKRQDLIKASLDITVSKGRLYIQSTEGDYEELKSEFTKKQSNYTSNKKSDFIGTQPRFMPGRNCRI